jgi:hypothetical protein
MFKWLAGFSFFIRQALKVPIPVCFHSRPLFLILSRTSCLLPLTPLFLVFKCIGVLWLLEKLLMPYSLQCMHSKQVDILDFSALEKFLEK